MLQFESAFTRKQATFALAVILSGAVFGLYLWEASPRSIAFERTQCAPWVTNRMIVIAHHQFREATWNNYQNGVGYNGGEAYWCAALDYTLKRLGFQTKFFQSVDTWLDDDSNIQALREGRVHRVITNSLFTFGETASKLHPSLDDPLVRCRVRSYWALGRDWEGNIGTLSYAQSPYNSSTVHEWDLRASLSAWPGRHGTPISMFPHSLITFGESRTLIIKERARRGMIFGKESLGHCHTPLPPFVEKLVDAGFELHTNCPKSTALEGLINHGKISPRAFVMLLRKSAFVIGLGHPVDSPTPLEALANGAAWLNPVSLGETERRYVKKSHAQHQGLKLLGMPYVYNVVLTNMSSVLHAAEMAVANRFHSFVPFWNRVESVSAQVCANLLESDALCDCARAKKVRDDSIDCRGSFYATNSDLFEIHDVLFAPV